LFRQWRVLLKIEIAIETARRVIAVNRNLEEDG
jgi:hypothetical protein